MVSENSGLRTDEIIENFMNTGLTYEEAKMQAYAYVMDDDNFEISAQTYTNAYQEIYENGGEFVNKKAGRPQKYLSLIKKEVQTRIEQEIEEAEGNHKAEKIKGRHFVGCAFDGIKTFLEYEDDKIFIPSSYYCLYKCLAKHRDESFDENYNIDKINPYGTTLTAFRNYCKDEKLMDIEDIPSIIKVNANSGKFECIDKSKVKKLGNMIALIKATDMDGYHAVLVKTDKVKDVNLEHILNNMNIGISKKLHSSCTKITLPEPKKHINSYYVYDIETSSKKKGEKRYQVPEGLGYAKVENSKCQKIHIARGQDCLEQFLDALCETDETHFIVYAHNGGKFDHIFFKSVEGLSIISELTAGTGIKELVVKYKTIQISFRDSCAFLLDSLDRSAASMGLKEKKIEFNIVNKSHKWFKENDEWVEYLKQDVKVLALVCIEFEKKLNIIGQSLTTNLGIAGVAWKTMTKMCLGLEYTYVPRDPTTSKFFREALYGGRVMHLKKKYKKTKNSKGLICLDANSLYPSAMAIGEYPKGVHKILPKMTPTELIEKMESHLLIAEVVLDGRNVQYPLIPYRSDEGALLYPSQEFRGVYTSVDIQEAINDGYKIKKVIRGVYWNEKGDIFGDMVKHFYEKRKEYKKQKNSMEYVYKILLNSMYGKLLENIDEIKKFKNEIPKDTSGLKVIKLANGQYEIVEKIKYPVCRKPVHLGAFTTAYARKIMNNLIRKLGPENIYYSDTDSLYVPMEVFEKSGLKTSGDLGGFKNDYGDNQYIEEAIFLDIKRYYLKFNDGSIKYKFNGINFKNENTLSNIGEKEDSKESKVKELYEWFHENPRKQSTSIMQTKWMRTKKDVIIEEKELQFQVDPDKRYKWEGNDAYPYDYDFDKKGGKLGEETIFNNADKYRYTIKKDLFHSKILLSTDNKMVKKNQHILTKGINTSFYKDVDEGVIYYKETKYGKNKYYTVNENGTSKEPVEDIDVENLQPVLFQPINDNSIIIINENEQKAILKRLA